VQTHADVCGIPVLISNEEESVLVGAAMLGATASGLYKNLEAAVEDLSNSCYEVSPDRGSCDFHARKFKVFMKMLEDQRSYAEIMTSS
jgi:ribulose kinase